MSERHGGFDFLIGSWTVRHHRLHDPLGDGEEWYEQAGTATSRTLFEGDVSIDEMIFPEVGERGMAVRLRSPGTARWEIYWVSSRDGRLQLPVSGCWHEGVFEGTGPDTYAGTPILARYRWCDIADDAARWEQAFSIDEGATWRTNWIMLWSRLDGATT